MGGKFLDKRERPVRTAVIRQNNLKIIFILVLGKYLRNSIIVIEDVVLFIVDWCYNGYKLFIHIRYFSTLSQDRIVVANQAMDHPAMDS